MAYSSVIPAEAGIQGLGVRRLPWMPAFAGMTVVIHPMGIV
jgi:hypothetical protein